MNNYTILYNNFIKLVNSGITKDNIDIILQNIIYNEDEDIIYNCYDNYVIRDIIIKNIKNSETFDIYFNYLKKNNVTIDYLLNFNFSIDKNFIDNSEKYIALFTNKEFFIRSIITKKSKYINDFLIKFSSDPNILFNYLEHELYAKKYINISIYELFEKTIENNNKLINDINFKKKLLNILYNIIYFPNIKFLEDVIKILSHDKIKECFINDSDLLKDFLINFSTMLEMKYIDTSKSPFIQILNIFKKYNLDNLINYGSLFESSYIDSLTYHIYNIYKHDKDNLFEFLKKNKDKILSTTQYIDIIELDLIYDVYNFVDKDIANWIINMSKHILEQKFNNYSNIDQQFINIFSDIILKNEIIGNYLFKNEELIKKLYFVNNEKFNITLLKYIVNNIDTNKYNKLYIKYSPYISIDTLIKQDLQFIDKYYQINYELYNKYGKVLNFYYPKKEEDPQYSIESSVETFKQLFNIDLSDKNRFELFRNFKNYISNIKDNGMNTNINDIQ